MPTYLRLVRELKRNYVLGSIIIVLGIGFLLMFFTLNMTAREVWTVAVILVFSLGVMLGTETLVLRSHLAPIRRLFAAPPAEPAPWRAAYVRTHQLPKKAVGRVLGPHYFGLAIPAAGLSALAIRLDYLNIPYYLLLVASIAAFLLAALHAMAEFFLTSQAIRPLLLHLRGEALARFGEDLSLGGRVLVSIRGKFRWSAFLIGAFPLLVFTLAGQIRFSDVYRNNTEYWQWQVLVLAIGIGTAAVGAWLLSRDVEQPIRELQDKMAKVRDGSFDGYANDLYADEFSRLVGGFNHMLDGLKARERMNSQLIQSYITTLAATLDARDPYTAGHSVRVAAYSVEIGWLAGLTLQELEVVKKSALLHDIGKIGVRDSVLLKEGRLTDEEFDMIKRHPATGEKILKQIEPADAMAELLPGVRSHHERYDGKGYPDGLAGENIPLLGRIIAIADAFDAMTSDRPYRRGMSVEQALGILKEGCGTQWDPVLALPFIEQTMEREQEKSAPAQAAASEE